MRVSFPPRPLRRPPTVLERALGRRRARDVRRRAGLFALGAGASLLKPRTRWGPVALSAALVMSAAAGFWLHALV